MAKLFGESISEEVVKQLAAREEVYAAPGGRNPQQLRYLHEKTAWVRAISGIDVINKSTKKFSSKSAENFILSGGKLAWDPQTKKFVPRSTKINFGDSDTERYSFDNTLGVRPEPGITSFSISHKNRFGTIREANLNFTLWTRDDLNKAQLLFLRPGAQVIVEWGNSVYVRTNGDIEDIPNIDRYSSYFANNEVEQIYEIINNTKKQTDFNYDGFLGLVTNFTWSFRVDGGYDCSISVVSRSAVLESLTVLKSFEGTNKKSFEPTDTRTFLDYFIYVAQNNKSYDKEFLTLEDLDSVLSKRLIASNVSGGTGGGGGVTRERVPSNLKDFLVSNDISYPYDGQTTQESFIINTLKVFAIDQIKDDEGKTPSFRYVSLRTLLALINKSFIFQNTADIDFPSFYLGQPLKNVFLDDPKSSIEPQLYKTFDEHVSLDPFFAILPKLPTGPNLDKFRLKENLPGYAYIKTAEFQKEINPFQIAYNNITENIINNLPPGNSSEKDILNIHINLGAVKKILDSFFESTNEPERLNVLDFIKRILGELNAVLGNVNSFDIDFDEDIQKHYIVDREIVNEAINTTDNPVKILNVTGLRNTVRDLRIESKISSELSSMIAISNQADGIQDVNSNQAFIDWNQGTRNRFKNVEQTGTSEETSITALFPEGTSEVESKDEESILVIKTYHIENEDGTTSVSQELVEIKDSSKKTARDNFYERLSDAYKEINKLDQGIFNRAVYKEKYFQNLRGEGALYFKIRSTENNLEKSKGEQGLIPLNLSMTIDGISGLKIGQVFQIGTLSKNSFILPEIYNNYGFIITGINSSISTDNQWTTEINAITFKLNVPTKK